MDDLREAFAGESQANRKYTAFARQADKEGHEQAAKLFRAAAEAETIHALEHLRVMDGISDTASNLQEALGGETHEFEQMYPAMIAQAETESNAAARRSFSNANAVERIHAGLFSRALESLTNPQLVDYWVCPVCGNTVEQEPPGRCPICNTPGEKFFRVD
jgi:rubrerythrin